MKKLLLAGILTIFSISASAEAWKYETLKDDFDGDKKTATIRPDKSEIELAIIKSKVSDSESSDRKYVIAFLLPKGTLTGSNCKTCPARVLVDGKEVDPIRLLEASNFRTYYLYSDQDYFLGLFENNKVIKIQLPTYRGLETLTFTQSKPLRLQELGSAK